MMSADSNFVVDFQAGAVVESADIIKYKMMLHEIFVHHFIFPEQRNSATVSYEFM